MSLLRQADCCRDNVLGSFVLSLQKLKILKWLIPGCAFPMAHAGTSDSSGLRQCCLSLKALHLSELSLPPRMPYFASFSPNKPNCSLQPRQCLFQEGLEAVRYIAIRPCAWDSQSCVSAQWHDTLSLIFTVYKIRRILTSVSWSSCKDNEIFIKYTSKANHWSRNWSHSTSHYYTPFYLLMPPLKANWGVSSITWHPVTGPLLLFITLSPGLPLIYTFPRCDLQKGLVSPGRSTKSSLLLMFMHFSLLCALHNKEIKLVNFYIWWDRWENEVQRGRVTLPGYPCWGEAQVSLRLCSTRSWQVLVCWQATETL